MLKEISERNDDKGPGSKSGDSGRLLEKKIGAVGISGNAGSPLKFSGLDTNNILESEFFPVKSISKKGTGDKSNPILDSALEKTINLPGFIQNPPERPPTPTSEIGDLDKQVYFTKDETGTQPINVISSSGRNLISITKTPIARRHNPADTSRNLQLQQDQYQAIIQKKKIHKPQPLAAPKPKNPLIKRVD